MNSQIQNKKHAEQTEENTFKIITTHASYEQQVFPLTPPYFLEKGVLKLDIYWQNLQASYLIFMQLL